MSLFIFDVGGIFRDSSRAIYEGFRRGFELEGLPYEFKVDDVWHLRGIEGFNNSRRAALALFSVQRAGLDLGKILEGDKPTSEITTLIWDLTSGRDKKTIDRIWGQYKKFFSSEEARQYMTIYPGCEEAVGKMAEVYDMVILSNSSKKTIERDIPFTKHFDKVYGRESVPAPKPSSKGILKVVDECGYSRNKGQVYYVGDSVSDVIASKKARVNAVALYGGMGLKKHLERERPWYLFRDVPEMSAYFLEKLPG